MKRLTPSDVLRYRHVRPIPPHHKLRTAKKPGDFELTPTGVHRHDPA